MKVGEAEIVVPPWMGKLFIGSVITVVVGGALAWGKGIDNASDAHETRITVIEDREPRTHEAIMEIKANQLRMEKEMREGQRRLEDKLDESLERRK